MVLPFRKRTNFQFSQWSDRRVNLSSNPMSNNLIRTLFTRSHPLDQQPQPVPPFTKNQIEPTSSSPPPPSPPPSPPPPPQPAPFHTADEVLSPVLDHHHNSITTNMNFPKVSDSSVIVSSNSTTASTIVNGDDSSSCTLTLQSEVDHYIPPISSPKEPTSKEKELIKCGLMRKMKTNKKKYFVLSREPDTHLIKLEYWDSQKKQQAQPNKPNKTFNITESFHINRKSLPPKNKQFAFTIFGWENHIHLGLDDEKEMAEWMDCLINLKSDSVTYLQNYQKNEGHLFLDSYDHVWPVKITKKLGLGLSQNISGPHRVCLTSKLLQVFKVEHTSTSSSTTTSASTNSNTIINTIVNKNTNTNTIKKTPEPEPKKRIKIIPFQFPLNNIRKCGHTDHFFTVELGRSSTIGAGELVMETEDTCTAKHMHETIREAMKPTGDSNTVTQSRPRSSSNGESSRRRASFAQLHTPIPYTDLQTQPQYPKNPQIQTPPVASMPNSISCHQGFLNNHNHNHESSSRNRCDSMPTRQRCISEGTNGSTAASPSAHYTDVMVEQGGHGISRPPSDRHPIGRHPSYSPPGPMSPMSGKESNESLVSSIHSTNEDAYQEMSHEIVHHFHPMTFQPSIREEELGQSDDYVMMEPENPRGASSVSPFTHPGPSSSSLSLQIMKSYAYVSPSADGEYMPMSPQMGQEMMSPLPSGPSPSSLSGVSPLIIPFPSQPVIQNEEGDGYVAMCPINSTATTTPSSTSMSLQVHQFSPSNLMVQVGRDSFSGMRDGYLDMSPLNIALGGGGGPPSSASSRSSHYGSFTSGSPPRDSRDRLHHEYQLEKVKSFLNQSEDSTDMIKPVRAYSIGSKPHVFSKLQYPSQYGRMNHSPSPSTCSSISTRSNPKDRLPFPALLMHPEDPSRIRSFSMGSHHLTAGKGREKSLRERLLPSIESELGTIEQLDESVKEKKSSSVPLLAPAAIRARSSTVGSKPVQMSPGPFGRLSDSLSFSASRPGATSFLMSPSASNAMSHIIPDVSDAASGLPLSLRYSQRFNEQEKFPDHMVMDYSNSKRVSDRRLSYRQRSDTKPSMAPSIRDARQLSSSFSTSMSSPLTPSAQMMVTSSTQSSLASSFASHNTERASSFDSPSMSSAPSTSSSTTSPHKQQGTCLSDFVPNSISMGMKKKQQLSPTGTSVQADVISGTSYPSSSSSSSRHVLPTDTKTSTVPVSSPVILSSPHPLPTPTMNIVTSTAPTHPASDVKSPSAQVSCSSAHTHSILEPNITLTPFTSSSIAPQPSTPPPPPQHHQPVSTATATTTTTIPVIHGPALPPSMLKEKDLKQSSTPEPADIKIDLDYAVIDFKK